MKAARKVDVVESWTGADRIGKMSRATLRELRMRTLIVGEYNHDVFVEVAEALENLIEVVAEASDNKHLVVEELADAVREISTTARAEVKDAQEEIDDAKKEADEQRERVVGLEKDHDADMLELRKRAEKAEEALAESVRNGHVLDREADFRAKEKLRVADDLVNTQARLITEHKQNLEIALARRTEAERGEKDARALLAALRTARDEAPKDPSIVDRANAQILAETAAERDGALARANALEQELRDAHAWLEHARAARPMKKRGKR